METILLWIVTKIGETAFGKLVGNQLEKRFPKIFKSKTKEIVKTYESRIKRKNEEIRRLERKSIKQQQKHQSEEGRLIGSLKRRSVATEKLLEHYHKPLYAILISYASQSENIDGKNKKFSFIKEELSQYNAKYLGGTDTLIPPASVPPHLNTQEDLRRWFENKVLKGRYCKIKFLVLFDLRKSAFWGTYLPYTQKKPYHFSIGDVLRVEDVFTNEQIDRLAISEIIKSGDIAWLASVAVSEQELGVILKNQKAIEKTLGNPPLRVLANEKIKGKLIKTLDKFIQNTDEVANAIIEEAQFWHDKIKE